MRIYHDDDHDHGLGRDLASISRGCRRHALVRLAPARGGIAI